MLSYKQSIINYAAAGVLLFGMQNASAITLSPGDTNVTPPAGFPGFLPFVRTFTYHWSISNAAGSAFGTFESTLYDAIYDGRGLTFEYNLTIDPRSTFSVERLVFYDLDHIEVDLFQAPNDGELTADVDRSPGPGSVITANYDNLEPGEAAGLLFWRISAFHYQTSLMGIETSGGDTYAVYIAPSVPDLPETGATAILSAIGLLGLRIFAKRRR